MPSSIFPAVSTADVDAIIAGLAANPLSSNVIQIDGAATNANVATLNLKQLNIVNSAGTALIAESTGGGGVGGYFKGNTDSAGLQATGGAGNSVGLLGQGSGTGPGLGAFGGATGSGVLGYSGATSGHGAFFRGQGAGAGDGMRVQSDGNDGDGLNSTSAAGAGIYASGGGTSGPGIAAVSLATSAPGLYAAGGGSSAGIGAFGGATGHGLAAYGGASSGDAAHFEALGGDGLGMVARGHGDGDGADFIGAGLGDGVEIYSDGTGTGLQSFGGTGFGNTTATIQQTWSKADIVTNTTTTIKSGAGFIHAININKGAATSTITVYDNTAGSGTKIGGVIVDTLAGGTSVILDSAFATGLTVVTAGGAAADITVTYK